MTLTWTPRATMGARIDWQGAADRGWDRIPGFVGRPKHGLQPYGPDDPRVEADDCFHGQIRDLDGSPGPLSRCLDCGCLVHTAARLVSEDPDPLDDKALDALRQEWNLIQFGAPE